MNIMGQYLTPVWARDLPAPVPTYKKKYAYCETLASLLADSDCS